MVFSGETAVSPRDRAAVFSLWTFDTDKDKGRVSLLPPLQLARRPVAVARQPVPVPPMVPVPQSARPSPSPHSLPFSLDTPDTGGGPHSKPSSRGGVFSSSSASMADTPDTTGGGARAQPSPRPFLDPFPVSAIPNGDNDPLLIFRTRNIDTVPAMQSHNVVRSILSDNTQAAALLARARRTVGGYVCLGGRERECRTCLVECMCHSVIFFL